MPAAIEKIDITMVLMDAQNLILKEGWDIQSPQQGVQKGYSTYNAVARAAANNHPKPSEKSAADRKRDKCILNAAVLVVARATEEETGYVKQDQRERKACRNYWMGRSIIMEYDSWVKTSTMKTYGNKVETIKKNGGKAVVEMINRARRRRDIDDCIDIAVLEGKEEVPI